MATPRSLLPLPAYLFIVVATVGCQHEDARLEKSKEMSATSTKGAAMTTDQTRIEQNVEEYLTQRKHWQRNEFRIEHKGLTPDGEVMVKAVFLHDKQDPLTLGGGKSLLLHVDRKTLRVVKEFAYQ